MHYRQLGKSALQVSEIGFGCMSLAEDTAANTVLLHKAIDAGINFFDTADLYQQGMNEEMVGKALKEKRNSVIIATKVGNQWRSDGSGWDWNPRKEYILKAVEKSLQRLQTSHIDLYQLHGGTIDDPIDETIDAFEQLQQQGKIRYYGISSIRPNVIREYISRSHITSIMMQYSLLDRRPEEYMELLQQHGIGILSRGSLAKGLLAGKPPTAYLNHNEEAVGKAAAAIRLVTKTGETLSQTAARFVLSQPAVSSAVVGIRTEAQLKDIVAARDLSPLTEHEMKALTQSIPANYYDSHR